MERMTDLWTRLEGAPLAAGFELRRYLGDDGQRVYYLTDRDGPGGETTVIAAVPQHSEQAEEQLRRWKLASPLSHPNLIRVFEAGWSEADGVPLAYARMECPDDDLGTLTGERCLTLVEADEVLRAAVVALSYLHEQYLVHGAVEPGNILAVGETIKLSIHDVSSPHGTRTLQQDIRDLGFTLYQLLTQHTDRQLSELHSVAEPFASIIDGSVRKGWPLARIAAVLEHPELREEVLETPEDTNIPTQRKEQARRWGMTLLPAAVAMLLFILAIRYSGRPAKTAQPVPAPPATARPAPVKEARTWSVIAGTYGHRADAERRARAIARRWPQFHAQVVPSDKPRAYIVMLGNQLTEQEAMRLRKSARAAGIGGSVGVRETTP
ncbi:MAG: hypothetical protein IANPNBLG_04479 [Bryobacteraceae bacterium]|nr:hypothetical protein [Bryobacteraceae bacterium]